MGSKESVIKIPAPPPSPPPLPRTKPRERARSLVKISISAPTIADFFPADRKKKKEGEEKPPTQRGQIAFSNESHVEMFEIVSFSNGK